MNAFGRLFPYLTHSFAHRSSPVHSCSGNAYGVWEWAGAFGDLGTLIPFVAAYLAIMKLDAASVLMPFAVSMIVVGLVYRIPIPVQPMKAIGATAATQASAVTPAMLYGAGLVTAVFWLVVALTNATRFVTRVAARPVVLGIVLGVGLLFMADGVKMTLSAPWLAGIAVALTLALLFRPRIPAMFGLLLLGAGVALWQNPGLVAELSQAAPRFHLPSPGLGQVSWEGLLGGTLLLALPQIPLTLGNAIIAIAAETNRLFPQRAVSERRIACSTGLMNLFSASVGGVPLCHGAGGMAGHVRFGARTGGSLVILGGILLVVALFLGDSVGTIFSFLPRPVLGVILFFAGVELALPSWDKTVQKRDLLVLATTAGLVWWNMLAAFLGGIALYYLLHRELWKKDTDPKSPQAA